MASDVETELKKYREDLSDLKSRIKVLESQRSRIELEMSGYQKKIKAVVGEEDPDVYLKGLYDRLNQLKGKLDEAILKAKKVLSELED